MRRPSLCVVTGLALTAVLAAWAAAGAGGGIPPAAADDGGSPAHDVRILRDAWGVPHVFGRTDPDVAFGLAWAHAEDDFRTIQLSLLASRGRLAAYLGRDAAPNDYLVGLFRVQEVVDAGWERDLSPDVRALTEAYAAGLNLYAERHPDEVLLREVLPFTGRDVVAGFVHKLPLFFGLDRVLTRLMEGKTEDGTPLTGSNAFAVSPRRTPDGRTRLAVNSHQPWEGPVAWYEAHLHSDAGWDMVGGVFPGAPVIFHGHNRHLGWASTVNRPDLIDVYRLEIDPDDPNRYRFDGEWRTLERRDVAIPVKLLGPVRWTFHREALWSVHGPVLRTPKGTFAIRVAGAGEVRHLEQWYRLNRATTYEEWKAAMGMLAIPMFNFVYADERGNIAYVYNGRLPVRPPGHDWKGIVRGDVSETLWRGWLAWDRLPRVENPPSGFVQNCNSDPFQTTLGPGNPRRADYAPELGIETRMTNRALRALELFGADESITREDFLRIKYDMRYSERSEEAELVRALRGMDPGGDPVLREAREVLRRWDLGTEPSSRGAAIGVGSILPTVVARIREEPEPDPVEGFRTWAHTLHEAYGRIDVPWAQVNRLVRGSLDLGLGGGPDVLHAVYGEPDGARLVGRAGDSYVLIAEWGPEGVRSWSVHNYGSATLRPDSPHYADQAPLFAARQLKPVWMDEADIRLHLEREYRPGARWADPPCCQEAP